MNRWLAAVLAALTLATWLSEAAQAQPQIGSYTRPRFNSRPTFSPYLNLGRGGNPAINYYGIVRPQLETQRQLNVLQQEFQGLQAQGAPPLTDDTQTTVTGRGFGGFFNYSHFYPGFRNEGGQPQTGTIPR